MGNLQNQIFLTPGYLLVHRYSIQSTIGQGGFGITYLAYDQKLDQDVCIKELFVSGTNTRGSNFTVQSQSIGGLSFQQFVQRFVQEARQLARFQHPNIVRVLDIFQENSTAYMVMEYVKGETLKSKVSREGALGEKEAMSLISQLLDAVEEVHQKGMLHRDIKPDNLLITPEGRVVLIDFGSAREFAEGKTTTQTAMLTPGYAPIEQYSTRAQRGPYSDIYALGATMYYLLTGDKPIPAIDRVAEELLPPHQLNTRISSQLSSAVLLAMELKPEHRFQSVEEMRGALVSLQNNKEVLFSVDRKKEGPLSTSKKRKKAGIVIFLSFIGLIFVFGIGFLITGKFPFLSGTQEDVNTNISIEGYPQFSLLYNNLVFVQGGTFTMGCTLEQESVCYESEKPIHQVRLSSFYISKYEVTQALWREIMGDNPSKFKNCDSCPVETVSWNAVNQFIQKINQVKRVTGISFRLPTEAEWEYAARGGAQSRGYKYSGGNDPGEVGWYAENSSNPIYPVGQKKANELGLYDMSGNVMEWCSDWYGDYILESKNNPQGPTSGLYRVIRGGGSFNSQVVNRVSDRSYFDPVNGDYNIGFRLILSE